MYSKQPMARVQERSKLSGLFRPALRWIFFTSDLFTAVKLVFNSSGLVGITGRALFIMTFGLTITSVATSDWN